MNLMEKLAASHMSEDGFAAWEQEKSAATLSDMVKKPGLIDKAIAALKSAKDTVVDTGVKGYQGAKAGLTKAKDTVVEQAKKPKNWERAAIGGGALSVGAGGGYALGRSSGKKKGYKQRMKEEGK